MQAMGGVSAVSIALSGKLVHASKMKSFNFLESPTISDFAAALSMSPQDIQNLRLIFHSLEQGDLGLLRALNIQV